MNTPDRLIGVYRADGGLAGELRYLAGHYLRGEHCTLCDITHSPFRRKKAWDAAVAELGIPFTLLHRNELDADLEAFVAGREACIVAQGPGGYRFLMGDAELAACAGSVQTLFTRLAAVLQAPGTTSPRPAT